MLGRGVEAEELTVEAICRYPEPLENALGGVVLGEGAVVGEEYRDVFWRGTDVDARAGYPEAVGLFAVLEVFSDVLACLAPT